MRTVLLADDHMVVRQGLRTTLEYAGYKVVGEASDGYEAVKLCEQCKPDVAILDVAMPLLNGIGAAREIRRVSRKTKTIVFSMHAMDHYVLESLKAGVSAYVLKTDEPAELMTAINEVLAGKTYLTPEISQTVLRAYLAPTEQNDTLTGPELQVLQLIAEGKATKEIADLMCISVRTAERHRLNIMDKLGIHDIAGLVRYAVRNGVTQS